MNMAYMMFPAPFTTTRSMGNFQQEAEARLAFENLRADNLRNMLDSSTDAVGGVTALWSPLALETLKRGLKNTHDYVEIVYNLMREFQKGTTKPLFMRVTQSQKYQKICGDIERQLDLIQKSLDSLYQVYSSQAAKLEIANSERLNHHSQHTVNVYGNIGALRMAKPEVSTGPSQNTVNHYGNIENLVSTDDPHTSRIAARRSLDFEEDMARNREDSQANRIGSRPRINFEDFETISDSLASKSIINTETTSVLSNLYSTSTEGLGLIAKILASTEVSHLIDRLQIWGTGLFEGPVGLIKLDLRDLSMSFLIDCFVRICVNIEIILITLEYQDLHQKDIMSYQKALSSLLNDTTTSEVTVSRFSLAEFDERLDIENYEKILMYFDNIEDNVEILFDMLPVIDTARHFTVLRSQNEQQGIAQYSSRQKIRKVSPSNAGSEEESIDQNSLRNLVNEDVDLAWAVTESLRMREKNQFPEKSKSPEEAISKLFEAEIHALLDWRDRKKERITKEMKSILLTQIERFKATDDVALQKMTPEEQKKLLDLFRGDNEALEQLVLTPGSSEKAIGKFDIVTPIHKQTLH